MQSVTELLKEYDEYKVQKLDLNIERGQPSNDNFDLATPILNNITEKDFIAANNIDIRNYPGGVAGLQEARIFFSKILGLTPDETIVGNNSSLLMIANTLMHFLLKGAINSNKPWVQYNKPKFIVTVPGYDRHFYLLNELGFEMIQVGISQKGPDIEKIKKIVSDDSVKGMLFVPTNSNPTGDTICDEYVDVLANMKCKAADFTIFADEAYMIHNFTENPATHKNMVRACEQAGNNNRTIIFSSMSKTTFAGAGIGFMGSSVDNIKYLIKFLTFQFIGPNKIEQLRHVKFLESYPGGISGIMKAHGKILAPKFAVVQRILNEEIGKSGLASWTDPKGGYFVSLDTKYPVADRVVGLAKNIGVGLTPAGATYPLGKDPNNSNIRIAPTRPPLSDVEKAIRVLALCIKIASYEFENKKSVL